MKRLFLALIATISLLHAQEASPSPSAAPDDDAASAAQAAARSAALDLAGAFSNDGYKIHDGFYFGDIESTKSVEIEVNLFAGNEYWFCAAVNDPGRSLKVDVYDENGVRVEQQGYQDGPRTAAGVVAATSGKYLVKVTLAEGGKSTFCLIYCYK
jgi:hypothetical protein